MVKGIIIVLLGILFLIGWLACTSNYSEKDNIYIRIKNQTDRDIKRFSLGDRIIKKNSYNSTAYQIIFKDIPNNTTSEYQQSVGKFWGYSKGNGKFKDSTTLFLRPRTMQAAIQKLGIRLINTTMTHPYTKGKEYTQPTLPDGKYTIVLGYAAKDKKFVDVPVEIIKEE